MAYTSAQLTAFFKNAGAGVAPTAAQQLLLDAYANQTATGQIDEKVALQQTIALSANASTAVLVDTYQFFLGYAPSVDGLKALVPAYTGTGAQAVMGAENRFIAQSINLATSADGKAGFDAKYGTLTNTQVVTAAYELIIGTPAATAAKIDVATSIAYFTRAENITYLTKFVKDNAGVSTEADVARAVKAALIGQILNEAIKYNNGQGIGSYATATHNLLADLADDGNLVANNAAGIPLFTAYGSTGSGTPGTPGTTQALTINVDALTGTANDDTFTAVVSATGSTLNFGDTVNGSDGNDTLLIASNVAAGGAVSGLQLTSVETVKVNNVITGAAGANAVTVDMTGTTGVTSVVSSGQGNLAVTNVGTGTSVGFKDVAIAASGTASVVAAGARSVTLSGVTLGGSVANANLATATVDVQGTAAQVGASLSIVNTGKAATITELKFGGTDAVKTKTLAFNAGGAITIGTLTSGTANELTTLNATGAGSLTITNAITSTALATIDASTNSGGVDLTIGSVAALATVKGGSGADSIALTGALLGTATVDLGGGDDTLTLTAVPLAGANGRINGGSGNDTLGLAASGIFTAVTQAAITGFEIVSLSGVGTTYDVALFNGFTGGIRVAGGSVTLNNAAANPTYTVTGAATSLAINLANATGGSDNVNLNLGVAGKNAASTGPLQVVGVEQVTVNSINGTAAGATSQAANGITLDAANTSLAKIVATGNGALNISTAAAARALDIDASALTNSLNILGRSGFALNVIGTNSNDTIVGGSAGGQINTGKGGDSIDLGGGADIVILKAGDSVLDLVETAGAGNKGTMDVIQNFTRGTDKIDLTQIAGFGTTGQGVSNVTVATEVEMTTLLAKTDGSIFKSGGGLQRGVLDITLGTDHYVVIDVNHDGNYSSADMIVKIIGGGNLTATDFNFGS